MMRNGPIIWGDSDFIWWRKQFHFEETKMHRDSSRFRRFTVVGFYPETLERFCEHISAKNCAAAERHINRSHPEVAICGVFDGVVKCVDRKRYVSLN